MTVSNVVLQKNIISKQDRNRLLGNRSLVVWLTGLSGSGKSTLADLLEQKLFHKGILSYILDGDNTRLGLNKDLNFSNEDRKENIRRVAEVAKLFCDAGIIVICSLISPFRQERNAARDLINKTEFIEVYVKCPLATCEKRDVKGLYKKARSGEIKNFTAIDSPYEEPEHPDYTVDTEKTTPEESVMGLFNYIMNRISL